MDSEELRDGDEIDAHINAESYQQPPDAPQLDLALDENNINAESASKDESYQQPPEDTQLDLALGSVFGAFIGDALGSYIEFKKHINTKLLKETLEMNGGGPFQLGPGQVTDDSELAMCMLRGLCDGNGKLNLDSIAYYYKQWICTGPFDIGNTTSNALGVYRNSEPIAKLSIDSASIYNQNSQSNGSFMRCTPMAVFCRNLSDQEIRQAVTLESSMTHSNLDVQDAQVCYIKAIVSLLRDPGNRVRAYEEAKAMATSLNTQEWFEDVENPKKAMKGSPNIGWVKIAFDHAFRHLRNNSDFETAMSETLKLGGDTDTNAAIVGGLIGAAVGFKRLPYEWKDKVMKYSFASTNRGIIRPSFLNQLEVEEQVKYLFSISPSSLKVRPKGLI
ncbi:unnamed protein product [Blepharisma stoltei]|uniref:Uncharacterized protein n=1 Tax=Blepharisma stoltei TaxID=1481888 RepID=A0AAU9IRC0_9CILI|nr:unnamed protein product [Blepharisma stoltei]